MSALAVALALFAAAPSEPPASTNEAAQPPAAGAPAAAAASDEKPKQVCVTKSQLGTRFKQRICYDKTEYERRQLEERQALQRTQRIPACFEGCP